MLFQTCHDVQEAIHSVRTTKQIVNAGDVIIAIFVQVMVKPLNLALGLGAIWAADLGGKSIFLSDMHQLRVPAMLAGAVDIALNNDDLSVVEQQLMRRSTEEPKRRLNAIRPSSGILVVVELDEGRPAPAQRGDECQQWVMAEPGDGEINLHLKARQAAHGVQECGQHAVATIVTALADRAQQYTGGYPVGPGNGQALKDIGLELVKLTGAGCTRLIPHIRYGQRATNISVNGLARA